jgi:hypothetical protein
MPSGAGPGGMVFLAIVGAKAVIAGGSPAPCANVEQTAIASSETRPRFRGQLFNLFSFRKSLFPKGENALPVALHADDDPALLRCVSYSS